MVTGALLGNGPPNDVDRPPLRVVVNIPAARLDLWLGDEIGSSWRIAVGSNEYATPVGEFHITDIVWNPWWLPPESGWAVDEKPKPPGPNNPMGQVKLKFAPLYYLHGTPDTSSIGHAVSHGCIRMRNTDAIELARMIQQWDNPERAHEIDNILIRKLTRTVQLADTVPLSVIYDRFEVDDENVTLHPDPYGLGPPNLDKVVAELKRGNGVVDVERVKALLRLSSAHRRVVVARNSLFQTR